MLNFDYLFLEVKRSRISFGIFFKQNFDPRNCGPKRPINLFSKTCDITRNEDDAIHKDYITRTKELLRGYKNVTLVDPRDVLCDEGKCYASKGGRVLYGDRDHLNANGSLILGKQISDAFFDFGK